MPHPVPCHTPSKWHPPFARYATHNETFDWHDKDGDGHLDPVELEECVLHPLSTLHPLARCTHTRATLLNTLHPCCSPLSRCTFAAAARALRHDSLFAPRGLT
eukprot:scaffold50691_cov60-Phaeocystis_antarctica.AAC.8